MHLSNIATAMPVTVFSAPNSLPPYKKSPGIFAEFRGIFVVGVYSTASGTSMKPPSFKPMDLGVCNLAITSLPSPYWKLTST